MLSFCITFYFIIISNSIDCMIYSFIFFLQIKNFFFLYHKTHGFLLFFWWFPRGVQLKIFCPGKWMTIFKQTNKLFYFFLMKWKLRYLFKYVYFIWKTNKWWILCMILKLYYAAAMAHITLLLSLVTNQWISTKK